MQKNISNYLYVLPLVIIGIFFLIQAYYLPIHDFGNYYFGAKLMCQHSFDSQIYFPEWFNQKIVEISQQNYFLNYTPNTPFLAMFYLPFSFLEIGISKVVFNLLSFVLFACSLYRLFQFLKLDNRYLTLLPFVFLLPIKNNFLFGQTYFLLLFLLIEAFLSLEKKQKYKAGFYLSLSICLKVFPVFLLPYFVIRKDWKTLLSIGIFSILFVGITLFFVPIATWQFYLETVLKKASNGEISGELVSNYQSLHMFLKTSFVDYKSWLLGCKIALLGLVFFFTLKNKNVLYNYTSWLILSITFSGYGSSYSLLLLFWLYVSICKSGLAFKWKNFGFFLLLLICNLPVHYFQNSEFPLNYIRFLIMVILGGSLLFYFRKQLPVHTILLVSGLLAIVHFVFFSSENIVYQKVLPKENQLLITDYNLKNNQLIYKVWTEKGEQSKSILFKTRTIHTLELKDNQICYKDEKITVEKSFKKKPILVDHKYILFLSDYDRGLGFYDLKKIDFHVTK